MRDIVALITGLLLVGFSIYIFLWSLQLMVNRDVPSSLLAVLIGFVSLTSGVSLIRTWILAKHAKREESAGGSPP
ncbi:MAG: hypothetical protein ABWW65_07920 [Thermoprotei archaeon]